MGSWKFSEQNNPNADKIAARFQIPLFLANILINRGLSDDDAVESFLHPEPTLLCDPLEMKGIKQAAARINTAIERHETVTIYGDYDVDGITSISLLYLYLTSRGAHVYYYIPDRIAEGYGVHTGAIDRIAQNGSTLIVTVDTGITACAETEHTKALGIDIVITDHHECGETVPNAYAVCNPKQEDCGYPFKTLAGVGVVFKLICALERDVSPNELLDRYGDLVALGTIADVMPLIGENRYFVKKGLSVLAKNRKGLHALVRQADIRNPREVSVFDVSFMLAPRINAAGRIGDPLLAVELLITDDPKRQSEIAAYLCALNNRRQQIESEIFSEAEQIIRDKRLYNNRRVIVLWKENWHHGVIGIVASRIKEKYGMPAILFSVSEGKAKGSGRSLEPLNLYEALSEIAAPWFDFGGHAMAAGITTKAEYLPQFSDRINDPNLPAISYQNATNVDAQLLESDFTLAAFRSVFLLEPFGAQNEAPLFCVKNAKLLSVSAIGGGKHLRLTFRIGGKTVSAVYFGINPAEFAFAKGETLDVLFQASVNAFRGNTEIQMIVKFVRPAAAQYNRFRREFEDALAEKTDGHRLPNRCVITSVFRFCRHIYAHQPSKLDCLLLPVYVQRAGYGIYGLFEILIALQVLREIGVVDYVIANDLFLLSGINDSQKVSLTDSALYRRICSQNQEESVHD